MLIDGVNRITDVISLLPHFKSHLFPCFELEICLNLFNLLRHLTNTWISSRSLLFLVFHLYVPCPLKKSLPSGGPLLIHGYLLILRFHENKMACTWMPDGSSFRMPLVGSSEFYDGKSLLHGVWGNDSRAGS